LIKSEDDSLRLAGIMLLAMSDYPMEDTEYQQLAITGLEHPQSLEEERAWARVMKEIPITEANHQEWLDLFEEVLDNPQRYPDTVSRAVMERYHGLVSGVGAAFSEVEERELGLP
jgi:predicted SAM-dependent methyltransferase